ncbi:MAG: hypothetical protein ACKN9T_00605 [Candidatus Methylumidiphilus sp.]
MASALLRLALALFSLSGPAAADDIQFIYINASEGSASGGHVALKLDEDVFHFQHTPPGLLRIRRDGFAPFRQQYGERENRTLSLHAVAADAATFGRLRARFHRRQRVEDEQFDRLASLEQDGQLLESLRRLAAAEANPPARLAVPGLGLFFADGWQYAATRATPAGPLAALAQQIQADHGADFLAAKAQAIQASLQALRPETEALPPPNLAEDRFQPADYGFAARYADHLAALAALQALAQGATLRPDALRPADGAEFKLSAIERRALAGYRRTLQQQLPKLLNSPRPDWGVSLLIGLARLLAVDASLASGRLALLDLAEPAAAQEADPATTDPGIAIAHARQHARFAQARAALSAAAPLDEWAYAELEQTGNLYLEYAAALRDNRNPRLNTLTPTPTRPAQAELSKPTAAAASWQADAAALAAYRQAYAGQLQALYRYDLLRRNCATEIFRVIAQAGADGPDGLGGTIDAQGPALIPFAAFAAVGKHWHVTASAELPSYRQRRLRQAEQREPPLLVAARESNVLSSALYRWHRGDAAFVFFTDDLSWTRPLAGGVNLAASLGQSAAGLFTWPWDGGENLWQGGKGVLMSLPELLFCNIRKGSFPGLQAFVE